MEIWQRAHIEKNLVELAKNTVCNTCLLTRLLAKNILSEDEEQTLSLLPRFRQSRLFYEILVTRVGSFEILIQSLEETKQSGAAKILKEHKQVQQKYGLISIDTNHVLGKGVGTNVFQGEFDNRDVAVKVIGSLLIEPEIAWNEVEFLKKLDNHENIVRYYFAEKHEHCVYIALELCLINLEDEIRMKLVDLDSTEILRKCCNGLEHLHSNNIIHRDLKPANILLTRLKQVKISDFGLSKQIPDGATSITVTGVVGTADWMPPEILNHDKTEMEPSKLSTSNDIFSLGCIFHFALTNGIHPFGDPLDRQYHIRKGNPVFLNKSGLDDSWMGLIESMISNSPEQRPKIKEIQSHICFQTSTPTTPCPLEKTNIDLNEIFKQDALKQTNKDVNGIMLKRKIGKPSVLPKTKISVLESFEIRNSSIGRENSFEPGPEYLHDDSSHHANDNHDDIQINYESLLDFDIEIQGKTCKLHETGIDVNDLKNIVKSKNIKADCIDLTKNLDRKLTVNDPDIPPPLPFYIPRKLRTDRFKLSTAIFKQNCPDIFVFKGIPQSNLARTARPQAASTSGNQLSGITSRFILLEDSADWENICKISQHPVHLIRRQVPTLGGKGGSKWQFYILEKSFGESEVISNYIERIPGDEDEIASEGDIISAANKDKIILICDTPGMGKSTLLSNVAKTISQQPSNQIIVFISMSKLIEILINNQQNADNVSLKAALSLLFQQIAPSSFVNVILTEAVLTQKIKAVIFLDAFDDLQSTYLQLAKNFLLALTKTQSNVNTYVTSRPHCQKELENLLGVISYSMLPLDQDDQSSFFANLPFKDDVTVHNVFLDPTHAPREHNILGIPQFCNLLARVEADLQKLQNSELPDPKVDDQVDNLPQLSIFKMYQEFVDKRLVLNEEPNSPSDKSSQLLRRLHTWHALDVLLPELADEYQRDRKLNLKKINTEIFSLGILEGKFTRDRLETKFVHSSIAEYTGANFFAKALSIKYCNTFDEKVIKHLVKDIMSLDKSEKFTLYSVGHPPAQVLKPSYIENDLYKFKRPIFIYFLNELLNIQNIDSIDVTVVKSFFASLEAQHLYQILLCLAQNGYIYLFRLIKNLIKRIDNKALLEEYKNFLLRKVSLYLYSDSYASVQRSYILVSVAAQYSNLSMVRECFHLFSDCFQYKLSDAIKQTPSYAKTPIHWAIEKQDIEMVEFLAGKMHLEGRLLSYNCVEGTYGKLTEVTRQRLVKICKILLSKNKDLLMEDDSFVLLVGIPSKLDGPLVADKIDLKMLRFLVEEGADIRATYKDGTVVRRAVDYMSAEDFHELCRYLIEDCKGIDLFTHKFPNWKSPLHQILREGDEKEAASVLGILNIPGIDVNLLDEDGNNLLLCLVEGAQSTIILKEMIEKGADFKANNNKGQNALHLAVVYKDNKKFNSGVIEYLVSLGVDLKHKDEKGRTPLDQAKQTSKNTIFLNSYLKDEVQKLHFIIEMLTEAERLQSQNGH